VRASFWGRKIAQRPPVFGGAAVGHADYSDRYSIHFLWSHAKQTPWQAHGGRLWTIPN
jgi:hypothetical protein